MRALRYLLVLLALLTPTVSEAQTKSADRAWKPFIASLRAAAKSRNQTALSKLMSREFYYLSSGGDENGNNDSRDEAFEYWTNAQPGALDALEQVLAESSVTNTAHRNPDSRWPSRVAPPIANDQKAIKERSFPWYAVFEFRKGRWYLTSFIECCE